MYYLINSFNKQKRINKEFMVKMDNNLTIMIPTYNREKELLRLLNALENQTNQNFYIVVLDNHSDRYDIHKLISKYVVVFKERIFVYRNRTNIGGTANICKIFSKVYTKWAWLLGDDDIPKNNAVELIYQNMNDEIAALHFSLYDLKHFVNNDYVDLDNLKQFVDLYFSINYGKHKVANAQGDLICMSEIVYNMDLCVAYYEKQNTYGYTKVSQVLPFLYALDDNRGKYRLINRRIISVDEANQGWHIAPTMLGMSTFSHLKFRSLNDTDRQRLNLIMVFKYTNILKYWLLGQIEKKDINIIYNSIYKSCLPFKDKIIFCLVTNVRPNSAVAQIILKMKNRLKCGDSLL